MSYQKVNTVTTIASVLLVLIGAVALYAVGYFLLPKVQIINVPDSRTRYVIRTYDFSWMEAGYKPAARIETKVTGDQVSVDVKESPLPSPWYHSDDVQYFPEGPEFRLSREAVRSAERSGGDSIGSPP